MIIHAILELVEKVPFRSVTPDTSAQEACKLLAGYRAGALPVIAESELIGIISGRDVVARLVAEGLPPETTPVSRIMTSNPTKMTADESLAHAYQAMLDGGFRHLPVMDGDTVIGVISSRDIPTEYRMLVERWNEEPHSLADRHDI